MTDLMPMRLTSHSVTSSYTVIAEKITQADIAEIRSLLSGPDGQSIIPEDLEISPRSDPWYTVELGTVRTNPHLDLDEAFLTVTDLELGPFIDALRQASAAGWTNVMGDLQMFLRDVVHLDPDDRAGLEALKVRAAEMVVF